LCPRSAARKAVDVDDDDDDDDAMDDVIADYPASVRVLFSTAARPAVRRRHRQQSRQAAYIHGRRMQYKLATDTRILFFNSLYIHRERSRRPAGMWDDP